MLHLARTPARRTFYFAVVRARLLGVALATTLLVGSAQEVAAQPAPSPEEVQQAQTRWTEGKAFFENGNFEAARVAFKQAYTAFPHPAFLQNLGEAELRTGRLVEAARHLSDYLRLQNNLSPAQRENATRSLKRAAEKLGAVVIDSPVSGAEVKVDEEFLGKTPLNGAPWYLEPGAHTVVLHKSGYQDATQQVVIAAGTPKNLSINMAPIESAAAPVPVGLAEATASRTASARPDASAKPASVEAAKAPTAKAASARTEEHATSGGSARPYVLVAGAGLTVAAVVVGAVFAFKTADDSDQYDRARSALLTAQGGSSPTACAAPTSAVAANCAAVHNASDNHSRDETVRNVAWITAGGLGVATLATYFLWPRSRQVEVSLAPGSQGSTVWIRGSF